MTTPDPLAAALLPLTDAGSQRRRRLEAALRSGRTSQVIDEAQSLLNWAHGRVLGHPVPELRKRQLERARRALRGYLARSGQ